MAFSWSDWFISTISDVVGSTVLFDGELCVGGVVGAGDVDIDEASDRKVGDLVSWSWKEIVSKIAYSG